MAEYLLRHWAEDGKVLTRSVDCQNELYAIWRAQREVSACRAEVWRGNRLLAEIDGSGTIKLVGGNHDAGHGPPPDAQRTLG